MNLTLEYIANAVGGRLSSSADASRTVNAFFTDSRSPDKDKLFLALRGERVDGNVFVKDLVDNGFCAMTDRAENADLKGDVIYVEDVRTALQKLSMHYRQNQMSGISIVGITGSVGKTTTKDMVALAVSSVLKTHKTQGNSNSQIGLPQTLLATPLDSECAIVELGMSMRGEMERIAKCASPDISVITNIGYSHIENLGSREAIRDEKMKIASYSAPESKFILNGDEPLLRSLEVKKERVCFVSVEDSSCDCFAEDIVESDNKLSFTANVYGNKYPVKLMLLGRHYVINSLFALAVAYHLGIDVSAAANKLSEYQSDGKRLYIYDHDGHTVISDCYNASPESMSAALSVLKTAKGRRIAVLGDMLELGDEAPALHTKVGAEVDTAADVLVTYGDLAGYIASASSLTYKYSFKKEESVELKSFLDGFIKEGDTVLYKASNSMNLGRVIV